MPWALLAQIGIPLVTIAVAWGVISTRVDDHQRAIDGLYARTSNLEAARDRMGGIEEKVTSAAQRAQDAKLLGERLLDDRLKHTPCDEGSQ